MTCPSCSMKGSVGVETSGTGGGKTNVGPSAETAQIGCFVLVVAGFVALLIAAC